MSKRVAEKQLTLENFEEDEEDKYDNRSDTTGARLASTDVMRNRVVAKPKRRSDLNMSSTDSGEERKSAFSGFKGFGTSSLSTNTSPFIQSQSLSTSTSSTSRLTTSQPLFPLNGSKTQALSVTSDKSEKDPEEVYNEKLGQLNTCFMNHLKDYLKKSEFYDFSQVCREYVDYQIEIEKELNVKKDLKTDKQFNVLRIPPPVVSSQKSVIETPNPSQSSSQSLFAWQTSNTADSGSSDVSSQASANQLSQGFNEESMFAKPNQFNFTANKLSFGVKSESEPTVDPNVNNDEESEEPPKPEAVVHQESDSVFSKRCKLYYKKDDQFVEKGLGFLFIKKDKNSSNSQLLIRNDTKTGNILLNISLIESLPIIKAENNKGVLLTCIPNPAIDPKAKADLTDSQKSVTFLIRVKAVEDCNELFDCLAKYKT